jgi:hypothetical protein
MVICCKSISKILQNKKGKRLTPVSALTFKAGGWFEVFEATLDLLPEKETYKLRVYFQFKRIDKAKRFTSSIELRLDLVQNRILETISNSSDQE